MQDEKKDGAERNYPQSGSGMDQAEKVRAAPGGYEVRIKNHLDACWFEWFEGWELTNLENGEVLLRRTQVDQSALHGVLNKIRDLNLTLLSVTTTPPENGCP
jgi:hypothetical protein